MKSSTRKTAYIALATVYAVAVGLSQQGSLPAGWSQIIGAIAIGLGAVMKEVDAADAPAIPPVLH